MPRAEAERSAPAGPKLSRCPQCTAVLAVLSIIPGRAGCEYWTMRCTRCGSIHLDVVEPSHTPPAA
jgi:uncharacterized C2H2 Zn-finger protein